MTVITEIMETKSEAVAAPCILTSETPQCVVALEGFDVILTMQLAATGGVPTAVCWTRGDQELIGERYAVSENNNTVHLSVARVTHADAGQYTLLAKNMAGEARGSVMLQVDTLGDTGGVDAPAFLRRLSDLAVKVGTRTRFLVEIRSSSDIKVTWHRSDRPVVEGERFKFIHEGNFFCVDVAPVTVEDGGRWTCLAENASGRSSCSSHLNVLVPKAYKSPEFLEELRAILTEGGTVSLECKVVGVPTPVLRWYKDGKEIKAGDVFALTANPEDPTSLGTYTCEAVNCMGKTYSSSRVHVVGKGSREGSLKPADSLAPAGPPPIFTQELGDKKVKIGEPLTLACHVGVPPWPKSIAWYNKDGRVDESDKYHVMEDGLGGYMIETLSAETADEGEWKCVATNSDGSMGFSKAIVTMTYPKNYRKPRFLESLKAILTEEGLVSFECKVVGFPTPQLRWFKDGQELKPGDVYQLTGTNSLGSYSCIAKNLMGEATSSAELTVEDIQSQLSEEERLQLFSTNQPPKFLHGLKSCEAKINEHFRLTVQVSISPEPKISWYRDDEQLEDTDKYQATRENLGVFHMDVKRVEIIDQAEWKCVATNDFGHSVTSCFMKLIIPKHFKKPRFLECLRAILSEEGAVNLECKVIGVPQPVLKWYKDGEELKPGDIHRIISGEDGRCCLGTYTCEANNCMGVVSSSASLLGFEERLLAKPQEHVSLEQSAANMGGAGHMLARNTSLSTIHEERTSQMYDPVTEKSLTIDERAEVSFSFDGKEVSVSLYETPDLTEEEALQVLEMYADELSEHVSEHNVVELPPMRFTKESQNTGNLLMEAVVIDVTPEFFASAADDDLRTDADIEDLSISEAAQHPALPHDQEDDGIFDELDEEFLDRALESTTPFHEPPRRPPRKKSSSRADSEAISDNSFHSVSAGGSKGKTPSEHFTDANAQLPDNDSRVGTKTFESARGSSDDQIVVDANDANNKRKTEDDDDMSEGKKKRIAEAKSDHGTQTGAPKRVMRSVESGQGESFENIALARSVADNSALKTDLALRQDSEKIVEETAQALQETFAGEVTQAGDKLDVERITPDEELTPKIIRKKLKTSESKEENVEADIPPVVLRRKKKAGDGEVVIDTIKCEKTGDAPFFMQSQEDIRKSGDKDDSYSEEGDGLKTRLALQREEDDREEQRLLRRSSSLEINKEDVNLQATIQSEIENITKTMTDREKRLSGLEYELPRLQSPELLDPISFPDPDSADKGEPSLLDNLTQSLLNIQKGLSSVENKVITELDPKFAKSSLSVLESLSQPISDIQKGLALAEEKSSSEELTPGKAGLAILENLSQPIKDFQRGLASIEQLAFESRVADTQLESTQYSILENVARPVEEFNRSVELIQQLAMLETTTCEESLADVSNLPSATTPAKEIQKALAKIGLRQPDDADESLADTPSLRSYGTPPQDNQNWEPVYENVARSHPRSEDASLAEVPSIRGYVSPVDELQMALTNINQGLLPRRGSSPSVRSYATPPQEIHKPMVQIGDKVLYEAEPLIQMTNVPILQTVVYPVQDLQRTLAALEQQADEEARGDEPIYMRASVSILEAFSQPIEELRRGVVMIEQKALGGKSDENIGALIIESLNQPMEELERALSVIEQQNILESNDDDVAEMTKFTILKQLAAPIQHLVQGLAKVQKEYILEGTGNLESKIPMLENIEQSIKEVQKGIASVSQVNIYQGKPLETDEARGIELLASLNQPLTELQRGIVQIERNIVLEKEATSSENKSSSYDRITAPLQQLQTGLTKIEQFVVEVSSEMTKSSTSLEVLAEPLHELKKNIAMIQQQATYSSDEINIAMLANLTRPLQVLQKGILSLASHNAELTSHKSSAKVVQSITQSVDDLKQEVARIEYRAIASPPQASQKATLSMLGTLSEPLQELHRGLIQAEQVICETPEDELKELDLSSWETLAKPLHELREGLSQIEKVVFEDVTQLSNASATSLEILSPMIHELQKGILSIQQHAMASTDSQQAGFSIMDSIASPLLELQRSLSTIIEEPQLEVETVDVEVQKSNKSILNTMTVTVQKLRQEISQIDENPVDVSSTQKQLSIMKVLSEPLFALHAGLSCYEQQILVSSKVLSPEQDSLKALESVYAPLQELTKQLISVETSFVQSGLDEEVKEISISSLEMLIPPIQEIHKGIEIFKQQAELESAGQLSELSITKTLARPLEELSKTLASIESVIVTEKEMKKMVRNPIEYVTQTIKEASTPAAILDIVHENPQYGILENLAHPLEKLAISWSLIEENSSGNDDEQKKKVSLLALGSPVDDVQRSISLVRERILFVSGEDSEMMRVLESIAHPIDLLQASISHIQETIPPEQLETLSAEKSVSEEVMDFGTALIQELQKAIAITESRTAQIYQKVSEIASLNLVEGLNEPLKQLQDKMNLVEKENLLAVGIEQLSEEKVSLLQQLVEPIQKIQQGIALIDEKRTIKGEKAALFKSEILETLSQPLKELQHGLELIEEQVQQETEEAHLPEASGFSILQILAQPIDDIKRNIAQIEQQVILEAQEEEMSEKSRISALETLAKSRTENERGLPQVEQQVLLEARGSDLSEKSGISTLQTQAQPMEEKQRGLAQVEQQFALEAREEDMSEKSSISLLKTLAQPMEELQRGLAQVEQQVALEAREEDMSEKSSASLLKTLAQPMEELQRGLAQVEQQVALEAREEDMSEKSSASLLKTLAQPMEELQRGLAQVEQQVALEAREEDVSEKSNVSLLKTLAQPLEELQRGLAQVGQQVALEAREEDMSEKSSVSLLKTLAQPMEELQRGLAQVEQQVALEAREEDMSEKSSASLLKTLAQPMEELQRGLAQVEQQVALEAREEDLSEKSSVSLLKTLAQPLEELQRGLAQVEQQVALEAREEDMSEKSSVSLLKTLAQPLEELQRGLAQVEQQVALEAREEDMSEKSSASLLKTLAQPMEELQRGLAQVEQQVALEAREEDMSEKSSVSLLKTLAQPMEELQRGLAQVEQQVALEAREEDMSEKSSVSLLKTLAQPMEELQRGLAQVEQQVALEAREEDMSEKSSVSLLKTLAQPMEELQRGLAQVEQQVALEAREEDMSEKSSISLLKTLAQPLEELQRGLAQVEQQVALEAREEDMSEKSSASLLKTLAQPMEELQRGLAQVEQQVALEAREEDMSEKSSISLLKTLAQPLEELQRGLAQVEQQVALEAREEDMSEKSSASLLKTLAQPLEELQRGLAQVEQQVALEAREEDMSEKSNVSLLKTLAQPLEELQRGLAQVEQQVALEAREEDMSEKSSLSLLKTLAQPMEELQRGLALVEQQFAFDAREENISSDEGRSSVFGARAVLGETSLLEIASTQQQVILEANIEEMSEKTNVEELKTRGHEKLKSPSETVVVQEQLVLEPVAQELSRGSSISDLKTWALPVQEVLKQLAEIQQQFAAEFTTSLSEREDPLGLKTLAQPIQDLHQALEQIGEQIVLEGDTELSQRENLSYLATLAKPIQEIRSGIAFITEQHVLEAGAEAMSEKIDISLLKTLAEPLKELERQIVLIEEQELLDGVESAAVSLRDDTLVSDLPSLASSASMNVVQVEQQLVFEAEVRSLSEFTDASEQQAKPARKSQREVAVVEQAAIFEGQVASMAEFSTGTLEIARPVQEVLKQLAEVQQQFAVEFATALLDRDDPSGLKTLAQPIQDLHQALELIGEQIVMEGDKELSLRETHSYLATLAKPIQEIQTGIALITEQRLLEAAAESMSEKVDISVLKTLAVPLKELERQIVLIEEQELLEGAESAAVSLRDDTLVSDLPSLASSASMNVVQVEQQLVYEPEARSLSDFTDASEQLAFSAKGSQLQKAVVEQANVFEWEAATTATGIVNVETAESVRTDSQVEASVAQATGLEASTVSKPLESAERPAKEAKEKENQSVALAEADQISEEARKKALEIEAEERTRMELEKTMKSEKQEKEERDRLKKEADEADRKKKDLDEKARKKKEREVAERLRLEEDERIRLQDEEANRIELEMAERIRKQDEEAERIRLEELEQEREIELERERVRLEGEEIERIEFEKQREREETELERREEEARLKLEQVQAEMLALEKEEAEKKKREEEDEIERQIQQEKKERRERKRIQEDTKKQEAAEAKRQEEEHLRLQKEQDELKQKEEEQKQKQKQEEDKKREAEEKEQEELKRKEEEQKNKNKEDEEKRMMIQKEEEEQEQARILHEQEEQSRKDAEQKLDEELKKKQKDEEQEKQKQFEEEAVNKQKTEHEQKGREAEEERIRQEDEQRQRENKEADQKRQEGEQNELKQKERDVIEKQKIEQQIREENALKEQTAKEGEQAKLRKEAEQMQQAEAIERIKKQQEQLMLKAEEQNKKLKEALEEEQACKEEEEIRIQKERKEKEEEEIKQQEEVETKKLLEDQEQKRIKKEQEDFKLKEEEKLQMQLEKERLEIEEKEIKKRQEEEEERKRKEADEQTRILKETELKQKQEEDKKQEAIKMQKEQEQEELQQKETENRKKQSKEIEQKRKEEEEARKKELEDQKLKEDNQLKVQKEKLEMEAEEKQKKQKEEDERKQKEEEQARILKEREELEKKEQEIIEQERLKQVEEQRQKEAQQKKKQDEEQKRKDDEVKLQKEELERKIKEDELKQKELQIEKKAVEEELRRKKEEQEMKQKVEDERKLKEEEIRMRKEKEDLEQKELEQAMKQKEEEKLKKKREDKLKKQREMEERKQKEKEEEEQKRKKKEEEELKQNEVRKQKEEDELRKKEEEQAKKLKESEEMKLKEDEQIKIKKEQEELKKREEEQVQMQKEIDDLKQKEEDRKKKQREDEEQKQKDLEIKRKEDEQIKIKKEKEELQKKELEELKKKEEEQIQKQKEIDALKLKEEDQKKKQREDEERKQKELEIKQKEDEQLKIKKEHEELKQKELEELKRKEEEIVMKQKEMDALKQKEEAQKKKQREDEERKQKELEIKQNEDEQFKIKNEHEKLKQKELEELKKKEEEIALKQKEQNALKLKEEDQKKKQKEDELLKQKELEQRKKVEEEKKKEEEQQKKQMEQEELKKKEAEQKNKQKVADKLKKKEEEENQKRKEEEEIQKQKDEEQRRINNEQEKLKLKELEEKNKQKEQEEQKKRELERTKLEEEHAKAVKEQKESKDSVSLTDQKKTSPKDRKMKVSSAKEELAVQKESSISKADELLGQEPPVQRRRRTSTETSDDVSSELSEPRRRRRPSADITTTSASESDTLTGKDTTDQDATRGRRSRVDVEATPQEAQDSATVRRRRQRDIETHDTNRLRKAKSFDHRPWAEESYEKSDTFTESTLTPRTRPKSRADDSSRNSSEDFSIDTTTSRRSRATESIEAGNRDAQKKPTFCTRLTDRTAAQGSRIKLMCSVLGSPEPKVEWLRDGLPLQLRQGDSTKYRQRLEDGLAHLEVLNASVSDSGEFTCVARNAHGETSTTATLKVFSGFEPAPFPPTFTRGIKDAYHFSDDELVLECRVRSQPPPRVTWLKDNVPLRPSSRYQQSELADGVCRLVVNGPEGATDSGQYTCRAENAVWTDQISHTVQFEGRENHMASRRMERSGNARVARDGRRPHFSSVLTDHLVPSGGTIALQVEIRGGARPDVTWLRGTEPLAPTSSRIRTFEESGVYTLMVADARDTEAGIYTCRAANAYGHVDTSAAVEVVRPGSVRGGRPAMFMSRPDQDMTVTLGEDITISFRVQGDPKPRVIWMKGTRDITNSQRSLKETIDDYVRLTLKRALLSDAGTYCIMAKNVYGCDRSFVTVQIRQRARSLTPSISHYPQDTFTILRDVRDDMERSRLRDVPAAVGGEPVVVDSGKNWLTLAWPKGESRGGVPVLAYKVEAWQLGQDGGARWQELGISPINSFDAFNLKAGNEYQFRITPRNRYGWGESVTTRSPITIGKTVELPEFVQILPGQLKALSGSNIRLECQVRGDPTPEVHWYRDSTLLDPTNPRLSSDFNGSQCRLSIEALTDEDSGRYMCEATNKKGRVSTFARLLVVTDPKIWIADNNLKRGIQEDEQGSTSDFPPQFTMRLRDRRVQMTYPVRLTCQVVGRPAPTITWCKDGQEVTEDDQHSFSNEEHFHTLELSHTSLEHSGCYSVTARNNHGAVSCKCHLVVDKGIRAYVAPDFLSELEAEVTIREGGELRLAAQVEAYPTVGVMWHRDGVRLRPSRRAVMTLDHDGGVELAIGGATLRDAGVYSCTATNEVGRAETSAKVRVVATSVKTPVKPPLVLGPEIPYSAAPLWVTKPRSTDAVEGDTVIIQCEVVGDPKPDVWWLRDFLKPDYYRDAPHFRRLGEGPQYRLEIPRAKLDFTGAYSVIARNIHGEAKAVISLQIYAKGQGKETMEHSSVKHGAVQTLPQVRRELKDLRCCDGDAVTLECCVEATPTPDVRWEKEGRLVPLGGDFQADFDGETARLSIHQVYPEDEGEYTCVVYNELGKASTSACLVVDVPEEKETLLSQHLSRPPGLLSTTSTPMSTPRNTPRTTPSRSKSPSMPRQRERDATPSLYGLGRTRRLKVTSPKFYAVPHNRVAEEGETIRFQCAIAGHPTPWVTWDKDGLLVTPNARLTITEKDDLRVLELTEVTVEDAGLYRITLENEVGRIEASARLEVIGHNGGRARGSIRAWSASPRTSPTFGRRLIGSAARVGNRLTLDCEIRGTPSPVPSWYRNGELLVMTSRVTPTWDGKVARLEVFPVDVDDAGVYCCLAENEVGVTQCTARVLVLDQDDPSQEDRLPPVFLQELQENITVEEGHVVELQAQLYGAAPIEVVWSRDNVEIPDCADFRYVTHDDGRVALRLADMFPEDAGVYRCEAFNSFGDAVTWGRVTIAGEENEETRDLQPQFVKKPASVLVSLGRPASFCARLASMQGVTLSWTVDGRSVEDDPRYQVENDDDVSILHIAAVDATDAGVVTCTATSSTLSASTSAELTVMESDDACRSCADHATRSRSMSPLRAERTASRGRRREAEEQEMPATLLRGPLDATVLRGDRVVLKATFAGCPTPQVRWLRAGRELLSDGRLHIRTDETESRLTLDRITADEGGKYVVSVENSFGADCHFASVAVEGPPDPPGNPPTASPTDDASCVVAWSSAPYDGGCIVTGYTLEMRLEDEDAWTLVSDECHSFSHAVRGLTPGEGYVFRVRAVNVHGPSEPSAESKVCKMSPPDHEEENFSPSFAPRIVQVESGSDFKQRFEILEELGKGRFGVVHKVSDRQTNQKLAAKFIRCIKSKDREKVQEEIDIMNCLRHPKLLQLAAAFENPREIVMVLELISGGELFERVVADDFTLTERDCILFMRQIVEGVEYMHKNAVVHLDLKPENIMCYTRTSHQIKLIDFGLAKKLDPSKPVRVLFGTPEFIPPEIINYENIGLESDMWSVGVICYVLLSGLSPFMGDSDADTFANITRADFDFDDEAFDAISQESKDFISSLLIEKKEKRLTATECLQHKWLAQHDESMSNVALCTDKLKKFIIRRKWQKTGNAIRALGRMATLSAASRRNSAASATSTSPRPSLCGFSRMSSLNEEDIGVALTANNRVCPPTNECNKDNMITMQDSYKENGFHSAGIVESALSKSNRARMCSERSDSGISDCSSTSNPVPHSNFQCSSSAPLLNKKFSISEGVEYSISEENEGDDGEFGVNGRTKSPSSVQTAKNSYSKTDSLKQQSSVDSGYGDGVAKRVAQLHVSLMDQKKPVPSSLAKPTSTSTQKKVGQGNDQSSNYKKAMAFWKP